MRHTARDHFLHVVLPAFRDFASYYSNREMGLRRDTKNASAIAGALRDLPEHVFYDLNGNTGYATNRSYRESFWPQSRAYQVICNFADVWKHRSISRPDRLLSCVDDIIEYYALIRYADEEGVYYGSRKLLVATLSDKSEQDLGPFTQHSRFSKITQLFSEQNGGCKRVADAHCLLRKRIHRGAAALPNFR